MARHGLRETMRRRRWARRNDGWSAYEQIGDGEIGAFAVLRDRLAAAGEGNPRLIEQAQEEFRTGAYAFPGQAPVPLFDANGKADPAFWFTDPVTGAMWPGADTAAFTISLNRAGKALSDVEFVWEPNRLQFLQPLAAAIAATPDPKLEARVLAVIRGWADANPPGRGVNWMAGRELALRLVSIAFVIAAIGPDRLEKSDRRLVRRLAAAHGRQLASFPAHALSAGNDHVAGAVGLMVAGMIAPDLPEARGWARTARGVIEREAPALIQPDGVGSEQSVAHLAFTMELLAFAQLLSRGSAYALSSAVEQRIAAAARFVFALADRSGRVPAIGDDDGARLICNGTGTETRYPASVAAAVGGLLGQSEYAALPREWGLRDAIFAVAEHGKAPARPMPDVQVFPCGGYSVIRDDLNGRQLHLAFDHGPLGHGAHARHGHADALAVWLSMDGRPVFIDAGTYLYRTGGGERARMRESGLHNTLGVAESSIAAASGSFGWKSRADAEFTMVRTGPDWAVAGRHDGYGRNYRAVHIRRIERTSGGFSIFDTLEGAHEVLPVSIRFLCAPGLEVTRNNATVSIACETGHLLDLAAPDGFAAAIASVEFSPAFGVRTATRQIVFSGALAPGAVAVTAVRPVVAKATARIVKPGKVVEAAWTKTPQDRKSALAGSDT